MSYSVIDYVNQPKSLRTFLCDLRAEISSLPTTIGSGSGDFPHGVPSGSTALVTEDGSVWVLNNSGTWVEL